MQTLRIRWTGIRPLIMHSAALIDPDNTYVRKKNELQAELKKAKKTDFNGREKIRRQIERVEWEGALYWNKDDGIYVPGDMIFACIVAGARKSKAGKEAEQAIVPIDDIPIQTKCATKDLDALYEMKEFCLRQAVRVPPKTGSRVMAVRPMIPTGWIIEFDVEFDEKVLPEADLKTANNDSGSLIGIGGWRPKFGRFLVQSPI